ncbi:hypothetical protein [Pedobacter sp. Leaf216]|uniref:hypothetical protein n=1 Tax=Pedobacter sp. Leaf216 TaxID=1735684 RepID=UPI000AF4639A|nr:hypothetical protein [Pedobacter sp. Leaf216]
MMEGENIKALSLPFSFIVALRQHTLSAPFGGTCADDQKALKDLSDISSKPFSYALLFVVFIGSHAFAALRLVTFLSRKR